MSWTLIGAMAGSGSMSALRGFGAVGLLLLGCGAETDASSLCVEDLTCPDEIEFAASEPGCLSCVRCRDRLGECESGGLACARDRVDLDADTSNGCEAFVAELDSSFRAHQAGEAIETVTLNGKDFSAGTAVELLALDPLEPECEPTFDAACPYSIAALKLVFREFSFDEVTWSSGVVTLTGPLPAEDDGTGVGIEGRAVAGFELSQNGASERVLAEGSVEGRLVFGDPSTLLLDLADFDFGGYRVERIFLTAELEPF